MLSFLLLLKKNVICTVKKEPYMSRMHGTSAGSKECVINNKIYMQYV